MMANMKNTYFSLHSPTETAEDHLDRNVEKTESINPAKDANWCQEQFCHSPGVVNNDDMGSRVITKPVVLRLEVGCEVEVSRVGGGKRKLEEVWKEVIKKRNKEEEEHANKIDCTLNFGDSVPGSSDTISLEITEEETGDREDVDTDEETVNYEEEEDDYSPLSGYPLVDMFPDLDCHLAEPECDCCHCDMSDKLGLTTSEPDLVLYSDRTSDTVMSDCRCVMDMQGRNTGFNFWEVED